MASVHGTGGGSGGNKGVILLLVGGLVILAVAGVVFWKRNSETDEKETKPVVEDTYVPPAPLVIEDDSRPIEAKAADAGPAVLTAEVLEDKPKKKVGKGGGMEKMGKIDPRRVTTFINSHFSQVRACYERRLKMNPMLEGTVDLRIGISSKGKVTSIGVNSDTVRDSAMLGCVKSTIRKWTFPAPEGGRAVFDKPFKFKKKN